MQFFDTTWQITAKGAARTAKRPRSIAQLSWTMSMRMNVIPGIGLFSLVVVALLSCMCTAPTAKAASAYEINAEVDSTMRRFFRRVGHSRQLARRAHAILVFPTVVKAGFGFGGEYGEGALHVRGRTAGYYNTVSASFGLQIGVQTRSIIIMFMTRRALADFRYRDGWEIGVDASVALVTLGAGGTIDTNNIDGPIIGFVFSPKGLMYNLSLEGAKISRIHR